MKLYTNTLCFSAPDHLVVASYFLRFTGSIACSDTPAHLNIQLKPCHHAETASYSGMRRCWYDAALLLVLLLVLLLLVLVLVLVLMKLPSCIFNEALMGCDVVNRNSL